MLALGEDRHVLITEYVEPSPAPGPGFVLAWCVGLLSRLAVRPANDLPAGGGWHRLGPTPSREIDQALALGGHVGPSVAQVVDTLADADDGAGLPEALVHADLTPPNAVPQGEQPPVIIDWIGVGRGPRIWPLAFLLYVAGPAGARRALDRYTGQSPCRRRNEPAARGHDCPAADPRPVVDRLRTHDGAPGSYPLPRPPRPRRSDYRGSERS